jgi:hypothetical protein
VSGLLDSLPCEWKQLRPLPDGWKVECGVDTGTYMSAVICAIPPGDEQQIIALAEFPNYRYVAHEIELLGLTIPEWSRWVMRGFHHFQPRTTRMHAWADPNTQFRTELRNYHIDLRPNTRKLELRTEVTREYMGAKTPQGNPRCILAPWLEILPYELEMAKWPDGTTGAGKFERVKEHDHTLDCLEHAASRRPRTKLVDGRRKKSFLEAHMDTHRLPGARGGHDPHLGSL